MYYFRFLEHVSKMEMNKASRLNMAPVKFLSGQKRAWNRLSFTRDPRNLASFERQNVSVFHLIRSRSRVNALHRSKIRPFKNLTGRACKRDLKLANQSTAQFTYH